MEPKYKLVHKIWIHIKINLPNSVYLTVVAIFLQGCTLLGFYKYDYISHKKVRRPDAGVSIPIGVKKAKRQITPSLAFRDALKNYREGRHTFPPSIWDLSNFSEKAAHSVQEMRNTGFDNLDVIFFSPDSTQIWFSHKPVYDQKIGRTKIEGSYVTGMFIFIYNDSSFQTFTRYDR